MWSENNSDWLRFVVTEFPGRIKKKTILEMFICIQTSTSEIKIYFKGCGHNKNRTINNLNKC